MKPWIWFRGIGGHLRRCSRSATPWDVCQRITRGPTEADVVNTMQSFRFPIMGFTRSYWDFYRGFSIMISLDLAILMILAWQVATISRRSPREAVPLAVTLVIACVANAIVAWQYFFTGPIVMSLVATACAVVALGLLRRSASESTGFARLRARDGLAPLRLGVDRVLAPLGFGPVDRRRDVGVLELQAGDGALDDGRAKLGGSARPKSSSARRQMRSSRARSRDSASTPIACTRACIPSCRIDAATGAAVMSVRARKVSSVMQTRCPGKNAPRQA